MFKEEMKEWKKTLKSAIAAEKIFVVISDVSKPSAAFDFLLKPPAKAQEYPELSGALLRTFVLKQAAARSVRFQDSALRAFLSYLDRAGERARTAVTEIEKISLAGFEAPLSLSDLGKIISLQQHNESFQIALSLIRTNKGYDRLGRLLELELRGDEPRYTLNLLGSLARGEDAVALARIDEMVKGGESEDEVALIGFALGEFFG